MLIYPLKIILSIFLIAQGLLLTFILPPFQKFDEVAHFTRAIALSQGQLFCKDGHFTIPRVYENLPLDYSFTSVLLENNKFPLDNLNFEYEWSRSDLSPAVNINGCRQNFIGYLPNTLGLWVSSWTHRPAVIFYFGRFFGFIFFLIMLKLSLKIINKKFDYILWFFALSPLVVHQVTAFSYDVVLLSLILPLTALWINQLTSSKFTYTNWVSVIFIITIISLIKPVYLPLYLLFCLKDWSLKSKLWQIVIFCLITVTVLGVGRLGPGEANYPTFVNPKLQSQLVLRDPLYFTQVVIYTWNNKLIPHFEELIGVMGWRNTPMKNNYLNYVFICFAAYVIYQLSNDLKNKIKISQLVGLFLIIFSVIFLTTLAMYLTWSPVGDKSVEGIQGRYWLPLIPFSLVVFSGMFTLVKHYSGLKYLILAIILTTALHLIYQSMYFRYFDWSQSWLNNLNPKIISLETQEISNTTTFVKKVIGPHISGLAINLNNTNKSILTPYQYQIMDANCRNVYHRGYLNLWGIQGETQLIISFRPIDINTDSLCLKIIPFNTNMPGYQDKLTIKLKDQQPQLEWLTFP